MKNPWNWIAALSLAAQCASAAPALEPENLGIPLQKRGEAVQFVTNETPNRVRAWVVVEAPERRDVIGIDVRTGKTTVLPFYKYGHTHTRLHKAASGDLYIYSGSPGHFFRYRVAEDKLQDLGVPASPASYWLGQTVGPDGKFYVGAYPEARLVCVDPATDRVADCGRMTTSNQQKYLLHPVAAADNVIYCPVGLHHKELWAYDAKTGKSQSILPPAMMTDRGTPKIWRAADGFVYGNVGGKAFRCHSDRIEMLDKAPGEAAEPADRNFGEEQALEVGPDARLKIRHAKTKEIRFLDTEFLPVTTQIYSVACLHDGKIWGGGFEPADTFSFDPATGKTQDMGHTCTATIQVYDILSHPKGLFLSSYVSATQDFYDPAKPLQKNENPRNIGVFSAKYNQERGQQLALGPDGMIYTGTVPVKGHLGGAIIRINPDDFSWKVFPEPVKALSYYGVLSLPDQNGLLVSASIQGGTSAIPTEKEGCVFLWNVKENKIDWTLRPIPGAQTYARAALMPDGSVFGVTADKRYYVMNPTTREILATGDLPIAGMRFPYLADGVFDGKACGIGSDALYVYDSKDRSVRALTKHPTFAKAHGFMVTGDGMLYYGSGDTLYRLNLK